MRKKSKKKQIVAMTLALSVLSSSVGMCGASAAEALSDTDGSGLQVTVVPLADNTETPAPTAESKTPAQKEETPAEKEQPVASTGDTDTGDTEEKGEEGSGSEGTPEEKGEEGSGSEETPEEKPEETPKEDDTDYSCAYDPDTGHFKITFNIKEDAEGDQTIELSKVQEVVDKYGEKQFDEWLQTDKGAKWMDDAL